MNTHREIFIYLVLISILFSQCQGQTIIEADRVVYSNILKQEVAYSVLLPHDYRKSESVQYPVIYLLHGINGDQNSWLQRSHINSLIDSLIEAGDIGDFIYIMPAAYNSYYINNYDGSFMYMDFFINELLPTIDSLYRTAPGNINRALLGISMGGFGSVLLGLKHPEQFGSIVSLSGAIRTEEEFIQLSQAKYNNYFGKVFGPELSAEERITDHWKDNSPYFISDSITIMSVQKLSWYIDCGYNDFLFSSNEAFHHWLVENKIVHNYHVRPGSHNWAYWYRSTINGLIYLDEMIKEYTQEK